MDSLAEFSFLPLVYLCRNMSQCLKQTMAKGGAWHRGRCVSWDSPMTSSLLRTPPWLPTALWIKPHFWALAHKVLQSLGPLCRPCLISGHAPFGSRAQPPRGTLLHPWCLHLRFLLPGILFSLLFACWFLLVPQAQHHILGEVCPDHSFTPVTPHFPFSLFHVFSRLFNFWRISLVPRTAPSKHSMENCGKHKSDQELLARGPIQCTRLL